MNIAGHKIPNWALWGGGISAGLVAIIYFRSKSAASSATDTSSTDSGDQLDPLTGLTDAQDIAQYGSVAAADQAAEEEQSGYYAGQGIGYGGTAGYPTSNVSTTALAAGYTTNAQWAQAVTAGLTELGYSAVDVATALGLYFAGTQLTSEQAAIVQAAIAEYGTPPDGTYSIVTAPSSGGGTTGTGGTGDTGTGTTGTGGTGGSGGTGTSGGTSAPTAAPGSVRAVPSSLSLKVSWSPVAGATKYETDITKLDSNLIHDGVTAAGSTTISVGEVGKAAAQGYVKVRAGNNAGWGPWSNSVQWSFKK